MPLGMPLAGSLHACRGATHDPPLPPRAPPHTLTRLRYGRSHAAPARPAEDWELVSSSSEGGDDEGRGLEEEAAALAAAFSLGEQGLPLAAAEAAPGTSPPRAAVGEPAPGSPQHLQLLHVLAAPLPPAAASAATQPHSTPAPSAGGHAEPPSGPAGERRAAGDPLCLRVVRSNEQAALEAAVAALEARWVGTGRWEAAQACRALQTSLLGSRNVGADVGMLVQRVEVSWGAARKVAYRETLAPACRALSSLLPPAARPVPPPPAGPPRGSGSWQWRRHASPADRHEGGRCVLLWSERRRLAALRLA